MRARMPLWVLAAIACVGRADVHQPGAKLEELERRFSEQQARLDGLRARLAAGETQQDSEPDRKAALRDQLRTLLADAEFREALSPTGVSAGYDNGFYIRSADDRFYLRINHRMQFRGTHYATRASNRYLSPGLQRDDRTGFDIQRLRTTFRGHAYSPDLTYLFELRSDSSGGDTRIQNVWVNYRFADEFQVRAGIFKAASLREIQQSSADLQLVDRSIVSEVFGLGRAAGVEFWGRLFDKRLDYYVDVVNSTSNGTSYSANRTITPDPAELDSNPAILARLVWHVLADQLGKDFTDQADLSIHETPVFDVGFHYAFNDDAGDAATTRIPVPRPKNGGGGFALTTTNGLQINQFGIDAAFKFRGFSASTDYVLRIVDPRRAGRTPFTPWWLVSGDDSTTVQHGAYLQAGYMLPIPGFEKKIELAARVGGISALAESQEGVWEYAGGVNYYIRGNKVKLQADVSRVYEAPISGSSVTLANVNDDALRFRVQLQVAF